MPFFSVIIPSYNRASLISKTISSVINQSFSDWECILVDDGSIDNTKEVVDALISQDARIKYVFQDNAERSAARNNGITQAKGDYVCFLDSDDFYLENHLQNLYEEIVAKNFPIGMFFTNYVLSQNGDLHEQQFPPLSDDVITYLFYNPIIPARVCIHKEVLKTEKFDEDIVIVEDLLLWLKIALKFPLFHLQKASVIYNLHEDNSINIKNNSAQKRLNGLKLFVKKHPLVVAKIPPHLMRYAIGDSYFNIMKFDIYSNNTKKAIQHLVVSIFYQRFHNQLKHKIYVLICLIIRKSIPEYNFKIQNSYE